MRNEVKSAVDFLSNILRSRCLNNRKVEVFRQNLHSLLCSHYQDHWFPEKPFKGSGYRCIRINHKMDPLISRAGTTCGLSENELFEILPKELTLWVDPKEVSYRIGEDGSVGVLFDNETSTDSGSQSNNNQESESQSQPQPQPTDFIQKQSTDLIQSCKDQLRYLGLAESSADTINFEYLATFVAS